jgi:hypothetical protein
MSTQLRLVESPRSETPRKKEPRAGARARVTRGSKARRVHWSSDWRLDDRTRRAGREGVAAARQALAQARRPDADLPRAS